MQNEDSFEKPMSVDDQMSTLMAAFQEEQTSTESSLSQQLTEAAVELSEKHIEYAEKEMALKELKEQIRSLEEDKLPSMMKELQMNEIKLLNGWTIKLDEKVTASITEDKRPMAMNWLVSNDFGGIIKTEVNITFDRGRVDDARKAADELSGRFPENEVRAKETVHPATLLSFVKEQLGKGTALPLDIFSVHVIDKVTVKKAKK